MADQQEDKMRLSAIRKRLDSATPGDWEFRSRTEDDADYPSTSYYVWAYPYGRPAGPQGVCDGIMRAPDCEFIASAHSDIAWLLKKLRETDRKRKGQ